MSTAQRCPEDQKVCVRNLPRDCSESELRELFASCGTIIDLFLRSGDRDTYAFVGFDKREGRDEALKLNDTDFKGSIIKVEEKGGRRNDRGAGGGDSRGGRDQNKIFVRGINSDTSDDDIKAFFGKVGNIVDYYRKPDANFCFIGFQQTNERDEALRLAGKEIGSSRIHVEPKGGNGDRRDDRRHNDRFHNDRRRDDRREQRRDSRERRSRSRGRREDSRDGKRRRRSRS